MSTLIEFRGLPAYQWTKGDHSITVLLHGGTVVSWTVNGEEQLFLSSKAVFDGKKAIRGGIPVIFPQFGPRGALKQHGFARTSLWSIVEGDRFGVRLGHSDESLALWAHKFVATLWIDLGDEGDMHLDFEIENVGVADMPMHVALHTYFKVSNVADVQIHDLHNKVFQDNTNDLSEQPQEEALFVFKEKVDRLYVDAPNTVSFQDAAKTTTLTMDNMQNLVVWNCWEADAKKMSDMGDEDYLGYVCLEAASVVPESTIAPGAKVSFKHSVRTVAQ